MIVLVDSDILIEASRGRNLEVISTFTSLVAQGDAVLYSPVSAAEVWAGARQNEFEGTTRLFQKLICAPADYGTGELAGEFLRKFARSHGLEVPDAIIAASAVRNQAFLWTRNRKHYPMPEVAFY